MSICLYCHKEVKKKDYSVRISTLNRPHGKSDDHQYFHYLCFVEWFNKSVENKARIEVEKMRNMAVKLMDHPAIRGVLEKVGGGEMLQQILGTPLVKPDVIVINANINRKVGKSAVIEKINDDRKKREKTRGRNKKE